jgi:hypothetical protein
MVKPIKTPRTAVLLAAAPWLLSLGTLQAAPPERPDARMVVLEGKDVSGTIHKKLGLPSQDYCWDECIKDLQCTGVRWGVIKGDVAGLCVLLKGELTLKAPGAPQTDDGKPIHVIAARKQPTGTPGGAGT